MDEKSAKEYFLNCGLSERQADENSKNAKVKDSLVFVFQEAERIPGADVKSLVNLIYTVGSKLRPPSPGAAHRALLVKYVVEAKVGKVNLDAAIEYLVKLAADPFDAADFELQCGVGVVLSSDDIRRGVAAVLDAEKAALVEQRYAYPVGKLLAAARGALKWADSGALKDELDAQLAQLLGPKTAADSEPKPKQPKAAAAADKKKATTAAAADAGPAAAKEVKEIIRFPDPSENKQLRPELLSKHLEATGGKVVCRFPPEPNGYLHIGHAKAMNLNFNYPKQAPTGGYTYLRFDDTNPEAEKDEYFKGIIEDVRWMGYEPKEVTYSSDHFEQLYEWALELIRRGKAYVCHQTPEQVAEGREKKINSPWRDRSIDENLREFEAMRAGKYEEGAATLRMKMDMQNDNPCMRDLMAYRIKYTPHPHAGDKWCIYPSYDYTHCLIDSIENISHSLCTLEFNVRRESYYWLMDALGLYKSLVWEYSRLNLTNLVLSKRRLIKLVHDGYVRGWDDPRMPTIRGFRRRGYPASAINAFCDKIGVTRNENVIDFRLLEECCREELDLRAPRAMCVQAPLKVTLINVADNGVTEHSVPNHPKFPERGSHVVTLSNTIYIEQTDFRLDDVKGFKRLTPKQPVGLLHAGAAIRVVDVLRSAAGDVVELRGEIDWAPKEKPKGFVHWVDAKNSLAIEVRLYSNLFKSMHPASLDDYLADLNPHSLQVVDPAYVDRSVAALAVGTQVQFERLGFFVVDPDSSSEKQVWNRVVGLKESKWETAKDGN
eukprot:TRINITY_DN30823_c0_g1_i1.p1 TRINITY_DN30823_c0_g1~~TRINITY_DN30823_c0_g1_i1.p1  ORF type:complete len:773 (-),score=346.87 TRINITY_DN30823_c0_g1_i1:174-2492(-)